jgi:hypothetical protein
MGAGSEWQSVQILAPEAFPIPSFSAMRCAGASFKRLNAAE